MPSRTAKQPFPGVSVVAVLALSTPADACTRVLYTAPDGTVITGRGMDWAEDMHTNLWSTPRGMKRRDDGAAARPSGAWIPKGRSRAGDHGKSSAQEVSP